MSRMYTVSIGAVAVTALQDLFALVPAANRPIRIAGLQISQNTDFGDAQEEGLRVRIRRGQTTVGSGGSAPAPVRIDTSDQDAQFTARANDTTQAGGGTIQTLFEDVWNVRMPYLIFWPENMRPTANAGDNRLTIELPVAPADSITVSATVYVEELP